MSKWLAFAAIPALFLSFGSLSAAEDYFMYVGAFTTAPTPPEPPRPSSSKGIYGYRLHIATGEVTALGLMAATQSPSFLAVHPSSRYLYAVVNRPDGAVASFAIERKTGKLTLQNQVASHGDNPCFIGVDQKGRDVLVANYTNGSVAVLPIQADGRLKEASAVMQHSGSSVNAKRQAGPHAHMFDTSPDDHFAIASDLGLDKLLIYRFDAARGSLAPNHPAFTTIAAGSGPRHFAFHPNGRFAYLVTEMIPAVTVLAWDPAAGTFRELQTVPLAAADASEKNTGSEVEVRPDGRFVYVSVRGEDQIDVLAVDPEKGSLQLVGRTSTQGKVPRAFGIDPTGTYLFAANQVSGNVVQFRIDSQTGRLISTGRQLRVDAVACIQFAAAK